MLERQYCASAYTIDFINEVVLLVYNNKLSKWLQPGGHIEKTETPIETAIRETLEETGINIQIVGPTFDNINYQPIATERYINKVGDMIDTQYLAIPLNQNIESPEHKKVEWVDINDLTTRENIDEEIKVKVLSLYNQYKSIYK